MKLHCCRSVGRPRLFRRIRSEPQGHVDDKQEDTVLSILKVPVAGNETGQSKPLIRLDTKKRHRDGSEMPCDSQR